MRIIYIANLRLPTEKAHGFQIMKMCESFAKQGNGLELIIPRRINSIKEDPFNYYGVARTFKIKKLPCLDLILFDRYIGHLGLWIESLTFFFFVFQYIVFRKADVFYTRDKFFLPFALIKKNIVFESHTFPKRYFLYSLFLKKLKGIVVITRKLKDLLIGQEISPDKILISSDGVDLAEFDIKETKDECRQKLDLPKESKIILYAGHFYQWKGAGVLLEAARNHRFLIGNSQFVFVGGTKEDIAEFKKITENLGNVLVVGHRPHAEIPYWLKAADVLVLPNSGKEEISKYWTSPLKMFEYMASKRPVVASDLPSIREVLNERNAILVEPDNPGALARGIKEALQNYQLSDKITEQAFQDVQEYTWQKRAKNILEFINHNL